MLDDTLDPPYNAVIRYRRPYCVITRTILYWNEQQKMLFSLSCHIIISSNDCWSCTACCRCCRLGYQVSAAAPYTALNHGPFSVMWRQHTCLQCLCTCLSTSLHSILRVLLGSYDLLRSHNCWTECTSAESTNLFSVPYYCIYVHVRPVYTYPTLFSPWQIGIHDLSRVITESTLYWVAL